MKPLLQTAVDHCAREALAKENIAEIVRILTDNVRVRSCSRRDDNDGVVTFLVRLNGDLTTPLQNLATLGYFGIIPVHIGCQMIVSREGMLERHSANILISPPPNDRYRLTGGQRAELVGSSVGIGFIQYNPNYEQTEISLFFLETTVTYEQLAASEMIIAPPNPGVPVRLYLPKYFS